MFCNVLWLEPCINLKLSLLYKQKTTSYSERDSCFWQDVHPTVIASVKGLYPRCAGKLRFLEQKTLRLHLSSCICSSGVPNTFDMHSSCLLWFIHAPYISSSMSWSCLYFAIGTTNHYAVFSIRLLLSTSAPYIYLSTLFPKKKKLHLGTTSTTP
jgi:hypothetical protein